MEVAPDWKITDWWQWKGSYSYLHLKTENRPGNTDAGTVIADNGSSPRHQIVSQFLFNLHKQFEFDPAYRYVSALPAGTPRDNSNCPWSDKTYCNPITSSLAAILDRL